MSKPALGEFEIIDLFRVATEPAHDWVKRGIGDDCAVIDVGGGRSLLVTTDLLVERVHFLREIMTPWQLGWKAMAVNVSDVAAMGGEPRAAFVAGGLAPGMDRAFLVAMRDGLLACARAHGVDLLGGDTTKAPRDALLCVTLLGVAPHDEVVLRSGASVGDRIYLGGPVGRSAAGLWLLLDGAPLAERVSPALRRELFRAHLEPKPQVALGRWLAQRGAASAMIDVSDGLLQDLSHVCKASGVGARVVAEALPVGDAMVEMHGLLQKGDPYDWALGGGEDYVLLFTVPPEAERGLIGAARQELGLELIPCGVIEEEPGLRLERGGEAREVEPRGWDHFRS